MENARVDKKVFWMSLALVGAICAPLLLGPERGLAILSDVLEFITSQFGWLYMWFAIAIFGVLVWLGAGKYGRVKFGGPDTRPYFSTPVWIALIFSAGIGGGVMYWGVIEWAYYYTDPPLGIQPESVQAAHWAATYPLFHWGFTAWAIYCLPALPLAYAFHVRRQPILRLSESCRGAIGRHADGSLGKLIDAFFVFGLIGAAGTSLGLEVPMVSEGFSELTGVARSLGLDVAITVVWVGIFVVTAYVGLEKGIKRLADFNMYLALALGIFIIVVGPTIFILDTFTNSIGILLQNFVQMSFYMDPAGGSEFTEDWTVFYWGWWLAYAPFVGLFAAKISGGRTIRGMILAMCLAGSLGCWLAFALLGNTSMYFELNNVVPVVNILNEDGGPAAIVATMQGLPLGNVVLAVFLVLLIIFLAAGLDAAGYTMAASASRDFHPEQEPARWHAVFWAVVLGAVSISMMATGGVDALQTLTIITAFPLIFVLTIVTLSFRKWLMEDRAEVEFVEGKAEGEGEPKAEVGAHGPHQGEDRVTS